MKKTTNTRREFIAKSATASAGLILGGNALATAGKSLKTGANDKVRVGFIGVGNRGT